MRHSLGRDMVTLSGIKKEFGGRVLFDGVTLQIERGDRIGLVGPNGAGKTTLFGLMTRAEEPDAGLIEWQRGVVVGHLPQESAPIGDETVLGLASAVTEELKALVQARHTGHKGEDGTHGGTTGDGWEVPEARFEELGGYQVEAKAKKILMGLGFREDDFERSCREMSGGWQMRVHLARLLVQEPDLLLLDEPTNHLDLQTLLWTQEYLQSYPGALVMISHDREFLNRLVGEIVAIHSQKVFRYRGNYDEYLEQREAEKAQQWAAYKNQQREKERLMQFVNRFRAKATKASQAQSKLKQIERMESIEPPEEEKSAIHFQFPQAERIGHQAIRLKGVSHAYGDYWVYRELDFHAERGQRIVLVGPNGAGKSTLLKLLAGQLPIQYGERELGHNAKLGYYAQQRTELLEPKRTVMEEAMDLPERRSEEYVRTLLGCFLFQGDDVAKRVSMLSGGEKSRLALAKLLLDPPNLLLMDEPTTHLDMASIDALMQALSQFKGTLVFISHDVYFIRSLANYVVHVENGRLTHYPGGYAYYEDKMRAQAAEANALTSVSKGEERKTETSAAGRGGPKSREQKRLEAERRQAQASRRHKQKEHVNALEARIEQLEGRQKELTGQLEDPETYQDSHAVRQVNQELREVSEELNRLTQEWEKEASSLAELDATA